MLTAWQGREEERAELIRATERKASGRGAGRLTGAAAYASGGAEQRPGPVRGRPRRCPGRSSSSSTISFLRPRPSGAQPHGRRRAGRGGRQDRRHRAGPGHGLAVRTHPGDPHRVGVGIEARILALAKTARLQTSSTGNRSSRLGFDVRIRAELARSRLLYGSGCDDRAAAATREQRRCSSHAGRDGYTHSPSCWELRRPAAHPPASATFGRMAACGCRQRRADGPGGPGRAAGQGRAVQPGDRRQAVHQPGHPPSTTSATVSTCSGSAPAVSSDPVPPAD